MFGTIQIAGALAMLTGVTGFGQEKAQPLETGTFHGKVHNTSGRATIYKEANGRLLLRLTNFKTSNGPDVHVVLIAAKMPTTTRIFSRAAPRGSSSVC